MRVQKKAIPLHSLSGTNTTVRFLYKRDDPWKHSIQTSSTTSMTFFCYWLKCKVRNEKRTVNNLNYYISGQYKQFDQLVPLVGITEIKLQRRVWSWLRMNASYRLNTCKSRGLLRQTTGARVSNAYPTCPSLWHSLSKERLIPNNIVPLPDDTMKAPAERDGDAFH